MTSAVDLALRVLGALVAFALAVTTALWEAFLTPLHVDRFRLPIAPVLAIVTNVALVWFTHRVTGSKLVALLPGVAWMGLMIVASGRTTEGDLVLAANNWVALATLLTGVAAYVYGAYRMITPPSPRRPAYQAGVSTRRRPENQSGRSSPPRSEPGPPGVRRP